ncbi:MAG: MarR family transcriptional regulator [Candidatus Bathyarchaeota archaeon]|nr:MarR family transcriptional regulator [Candidatus Bathyarchaeota archaeon]MCX8177649.1 MarR family transcriptional regulator [Candidatus Bathyarchaeota archaeon]MDW8193905.1 helix-turn-helix domain-containing protein [Nitrososphaerota archaeon]
MSLKLSIESVEDLVNILQDYGLTRTQAEILIHLTRLGPSSIGAIAKSLKTNRMNVYRNLKRMEGLGLIEAAPGRPIKYTAVPVDRAFSLLISSAKTKVSELEAKYPLIVEAFSKIFQLHRPEQSFEAKFRIHSGRRSIYAVITRMLESSKREVLFLTTPNDLICLSFFGFEDVLKGCKSRRVKVKVLTNITSEKVANILKGFTKYAIIKHSDFPIKTRLLIVDEREALTSLTVDESISLESELDSGFWADSPQYAQSVRAFFNLVWRSSNDISLVLQHLAAGKPLEKTVIFNDPEEYLESFIDMMAKAEAEVLIIAESLRDPFFPKDFTQIARLVRSHGAEIKVLTSLDKETCEAEEIFSIANVRHLDFKINFDLLVIDRKENLLKFSSAPAGVKTGVTQCLWSNNASFSMFLSEVFMDLWLRAVDSSIKRVEISFQNALDKLPTILKPVAEEKGWILEMPAELKGTSGLTQTFGLVLKKLDDPWRIIVGEIFPGAGDVKLASIATYVKSVDVKAVRRILLVPRKDWLSAEDIELLASYGIDLVNGLNAEELSQKISEIME